MQILNEAKIKYWLISYTDLFGYQRAKLVPKAAIEGMIADGAGFAGFASWLDLTPADGDLMAMPDMDTAIQLPWKPEVAWVAADLVLNGKLLDHGPRNTLKRLVGEAAGKGFELRTGVEAEFFLLTPDGQDISDAGDVADKPCYDQAAVMRRYDVISEICDYMEALGWSPYQNDHEDANGQFEMNWHYSTALKTADRHAFFKFMVKSVAEAHGFKATFMAKPFAHLTGNGCHVHISGWKPGSDDCLFDDAKDENGLSQTGKHFMAGVLKHAPAMTAILNPTVNSYRRIAPGSTRSGATWAPNTVTWTGNNRTHLVRIPGAGRFELRLADGAANPYLLQAAILAAGMDGMDSKMPLPSRQDSNMYETGPDKNAVDKLPTNLGEAINYMAANVTLRERLGQAVCESYLKLKSSEWEGYLRHFSKWEIDNAIDI
jgi:glutamate---methylamine ligase